jgi:nucleoside-diphosphate-sugar epimerase
VTGHLGYIGAHAVELLTRRGHFVKGVDLNLFEESTYLPDTLPDESIIADIFSLTKSDFEGFDAVIHLAGICNDPMGMFAPELTWRFNFEGSLHVARMAKAAGVPRFLFSSSCSIYGRAGDLGLAEDAEVVPITMYATTKIEGEQAIAQMADDRFSPVFLRNATAYGSSPRLRLDLVVNELCARAYATGELRILSDGTPWRPFIHCRDIALAFVHLAEAPVEKVHNQVFNVGRSDENFQVRDVVDMILEALPGSRAVYTGEGSIDARDYRVDFSKLESTFPDLKFQHTVRETVRQMLREFEANGMTLEMIEGSRFSRLRTLKERIGELEFGEFLHRTGATA